MGLMATVYNNLTARHSNYSWHCTEQCIDTHCELHAYGHKQRIESSPLGQSGSGSGLGNQSSLHKLLTRDLTDMLNEGEGNGREGGGDY